MTAKASKISRRRFLKTGTALASAGAIATVAMPNVSRAQTNVLKMQTSWGSTSPFQDMARQYVERVTAMTGHRLRIDLRPSGTFVKAFQVQDAVHKGVIDAGHTVTAYWYIKNKAAALFGTGPVFGCNPIQFLAWMQSGGGKELYREVIQDVLKLNIVGFLATPLPAQPLGWFKKHIKTVQDLVGLKYRTVGLATDIMLGIGLKVTQLAGGEILPALKRETIEAFEFNSPQADRYLGAQKVLKHYHLGSFHQAQEFFEIIFNKTRFERLPDEIKAILEYSSESVTISNYGYILDNYSKSLQDLINYDGVNAYKTSREIMDAQLGSWDRILEILSRDSFFRKIVESQKAWAKRVGFYQLMNDPDYKLAYEHYFPGRLPF